MEIWWGKTYYIAIATIFKTSYIELEYNEQN